MGKKKTSPKGDGKERKKAVTVSLRPSLYGDVQKIAYVRRATVSAILEELLESYRQAHQKELAKYRKLKSGARPASPDRGGTP